MSTLSENSPAAVKTTRNIEADKATEPVKSRTQPIENAPAPTTPSVPSEYTSALKSAELYSTMYQSKAGIYDLLTIDSEYGNKYSLEAAQYAIDNLQVDYKENALKSAQVYQEILPMSPEELFEQLTSEFGNQFTDRKSTRLNSSHWE